MGPSTPHAPPPAAAEDPKYLIQFYDTRLGKAFADTEKYAKLFPNSYEAGEFWKGRYDLSCFTPGHLHPDNVLSPSYAQAASGSGSGGKGKKNAGKPPSTQQVASVVVPPIKNGPPSLPGATPHFTKRLAKAQAAFVAIKRLSPPGMGLPPFLCHRLASSLLFPILSYGADTFKPTVHMTRRLAAFWHKVQRWSTNWFSCTPTEILAVEACLPPLDLLLEYKYRLACLRVMCSPPEINPETARLPASLQTPSLDRHAPDHRILSRGNPGSSLPFPWRKPRPPAKNRTHLPLDALPHSMLFTLGPDGAAPLPVTSQHLLGETYPAPPLGRAYLQLKLLCRKPLMEDWEEAAPDPTRYAYRPWLKPHPFMGVTGLFLSNENTIGPAIDLLALVLREASRDRR